MTSRVVKFSQLKNISLISVTLLVLKEETSSAVPRSGNAAWNANVYSGNDWSSMENAGAVFLPTAGYRLYDEDTHATMVGNVGSICFYWSSSIEPTSWLLQGYIIEYGEDKDIKEYSKARYLGHSVRLVTKVNQ